MLMYAAVGPHHHTPDPEHRRTRNAAPESSCKSAYVDELRASTLWYIRPMGQPCRRRRTTNPDTASVQLAERGKGHQFMIVSLSNLQR